MSNYTKTTNFLAKDSLPEADSGKIIKGSEFDTEFNALQTAVNTKADLASPALTGVPTAPTASAGTNTTQLATTAFALGVPDTARTYTTLQTFKDTTFEVTDDADTTKKLNLQLSGITTATTRTLTVPDKNGTIAVTTDIALADPLNAAANTVVSGSYAVTSSATISITATNTFTAGQTVFIQFTNSSGSALTAGDFTIVTATGSSFTITYGSSVTSGGTCITTRYGSVALATSTDLSARTTTLRAVTPSALTITSATAQNTTSGTSIDFTGIPSWVKRITVMFSEVSSNSTGVPIIQLGTSSGIQATGYLAGAGVTTGSGTGLAAQTTGFPTTYSNLATFVFSGSAILSLLNPSTGTWVYSSILFVSGGATGIEYSGGTKTLSGTLDRVRITTTGTDSFDAGTINIMYE